MKYTCNNENPQLKNISTYNVALINKLSFINIVILSYLILKYVPNIRSIPKVNYVYF